MIARVRLLNPVPVNGAVYNEDGVLVGRVINCREVRGSYLIEIDVDDSALPDEDDAFSIGVKNENGNG